MGQFGYSPIGSQWEKILLESGSFIETLLLYYEAARKNVYQSLDAYHYNMKSNLLIIIADE